MYNNIPEIAKYFSAMELDKSPNTIKSYNNAVNKFLDDTKFTSIQEIENCNGETIRKFQKNLKDQGIENATINSIMAPLKAMMSWMCFEENRYAKKNPFAGIKALKTQKKIQAYMEEWEVTKLISSTKSFENKVIFLLYLTTGLRRIELVNLELSGFDGEKIDFIGKGNIQASIPLMPEVANMLWMYIEWRNKKFGNENKEIFISKNRKKYCEGAMWYKLKSELKKAGFSDERVDELHVHSLRHTFCANVGEQTGDAFTLQKAMRHSRVSTTELYMHMKDKKVGNAILSQNFMQKGSV